MFRTFCERMDEDPGLTLAKLEDRGFTSTRTGRLNRAAARIRNDLEMYGDFSLEDALQACDLDQLTDAEIKYLEGRLNS
mgnify:CR=1 FL=1